MPGAGSELLLRYEELDALPDVRGGTHGTNFSGVVCGTAGGRRRGNVAGGGGELLLPSGKARGLDVPPVWTFSVHALPRGVQGPGLVSRLSRIQQPQAQRSRFRESPHSLRFGRSGVRHVSISAAVLAI